MTMPNQRMKDENQISPRSYFGELLLMIIGVIFLTMSIAPTEEMILIAFRMTHWHTLALAVGTLIMMHAVVYAVKFRGQEKTPEGVSFVSLFVRYTMVGYAVVLLVCLYLLWTFGRTRRNERERNCKSRDSFRFSRRTRRVRFAFDFIKNGR